MDSKYPPFVITPMILKLVADIQEMLGEIKSLTLKKPPLRLRKENKIKTIHYSLAIEGNVLTEDQVTEILENKKVVGPKKQILEVKNALSLYEKIDQLRPQNEKDFLHAHKVLMQDLVARPGLYRSGAVGIFKNDKISKMAPPAKLVPKLMGDLFSFLKNDQMTHALLKACIFHYELELIHPFLDGNGRMGRLWQQLLLMKVSSLFEYLPVETLIHRHQKQYYASLEQSDLAGNSTAFVEFSLQMIKKSLEEFSGQISQKPKASDRIDFALEHFGKKSFTRKDYLALFKNLSTATASRDLAKAVTEKKLHRAGTQSQAVYRR